MKESSKANSSHYRLEHDGRFVITAYNSSKPFSSFFPGIAGVHGIPMWVFYVNRGQCVCSFGFQDKDHAILEFLPANEAYSLAARQGFRTFIQTGDSKPGDYYEPFQDTLRDRDHDFDRQQRMIIEPSGLTLEEENRSLNLTFTVQYFTVPEDRFAGLVRILKIRNTGPAPVTVNGLDGLPEIVPCGVDNYLLKNMKRTIEAFLEVVNLENNAPFFRVKVEPADRPDVRRIEAGSFYLAFEPGDNPAEPLKPIVDPRKIFAHRNDFSLPEAWLASPYDELVVDQSLENQFPCAMAGFERTIPAGGEHTVATIIGHAGSQDKLNGMVERLASPEFLSEKAGLNEQLISSLTQHNLICSAEPTLDHYVRQNFLDNLMRGGFPYTFDANGTHRTLYVFSRKHGDLERDYNDFRLTPTPYSQGNGNYRDINQNRRSDLLFNPDVGAHNVEYFYNLIQLDGFNPLVLKETRFDINDRQQLDSVLDKSLASEHRQAVRSFLDQPFTPGEVLLFLAEQGIAAATSADRLLDDLFSISRAIPQTDHGEGFWIDHWTYNLDLLESYLAVFPDRFEKLLFADNRFTFYNNAHVVLPRSRKYVLWDNQPMQLGAVTYDEEKAALMSRYQWDRDKVRVDFGEGDVYRTSLLNKLLCLIANKLASLDPEGVGVEMEAGKPGWYDALNGLPGLFGSSVSETLEIKRHILFLRKQLAGRRDRQSTLPLFEELADFIDLLQGMLTEKLSNAEFWDSATTAKEQFRARTRLGVGGAERVVSPETIESFLVATLEKLEQAIERAHDDNSGTLYSFFRHEVVEYEVRTSTEDGQAGEPVYNADGLPCIKVTQFRQIPLPLFLEGPVHYLRCKPEKHHARNFAENVRRSALYDRKLKMYKVNASLADEPLGIGRARVFSPGWLENESIWLHMEYKYLLELLRNELYDEFFRDFRDAAVPYLSPDMYGRSILENSSFLASSAHPDTSIHGTGYVARLSGATAEFIHMLLLMAAGPSPFSLSPDGELAFAPQPVLPAWLFSTRSRNVRLNTNGECHQVSIPKRSFSFMFLGTILITYHNEAQRDTYGERGVQPAVWTVHYPGSRNRTFNAPSVSGDAAVDIRARKVNRIDIELR